MRFHAFWALRVSRKILHTFWLLCDFLMRFDEISCFLAAEFSF
jgi:hypothetical protein